MQRAFFFFVLKKKTDLKNKNNYDISQVLIKMRPLISLIFSQYGLACKYGTIFQISVYNWMQNFVSDNWHNNCQSGKPITDT